MRCWPNLVLECATLFASDSWGLIYDIKAHLTDVGRNDNGK